MIRLIRYKWKLMDARYIVWSNGKDELARGFWKVRFSCKNGSILWKEPLKLMPKGDK